MFLQLQPLTLHLSYETRIRPDLESGQGFLSTGLKRMTDETIFLTGFPGFIAGRLVKRLAQDGARFLLLVQPAWAERARVEAARISVETGRPATDFRIIEGDITQPDLGIGGAELEQARQETTHLFHLAAIYDLAVGHDVAVKVNVEGTRRVNEFARSLKSLRRYHYVSTCYVAGLRRGLILETELAHRSRLSQPLRGDKISGRA